ncbi:MAG TPA: peptide ABC transporter substrate-binding protein, partial [Herpetosiphonaceae bacterium]|nr:peptide ABC transporter substrate-binding protein [Herpetosiphonaceae bacterium]
SIVINNELITDTSTLTGPIELEQVQVTWTLVDGLTWEDGTPLTAEDFVFAAELYRSPDIKLTTRFVLDRTEKYEAPDAKTLVWYGAPGYEDATYFLNFFGPEPKHVLESTPPAEIGAGDYANQPLAYGPYKIVENIPQESTTLVANPTYWRAAEGLPRIGNVVFKYLTSEDQILQQLESGEVDVALSGIGLTVAQAPQLDQMESAGTLTAQYVAGTSWDHLDFGMIRSDGPESFFSDPKVRQAFAYAINRQEIVDEVMFGKAPIMNSILPEEHWAYPPAGQGLETYVYDPERAGQLLDEAGWTLGADGIRAKDGRQMSKIQFYTTENNQSRQAVAQVIQENLKQVGIDIELNFVPGTAVLFANGEDGILSNHTFDLAMYGFTSSSDPNMSLYLCNQIPSADNNYDGQNNPGYCSQEFDDVALAANAETDREARIPLVVQAQQIINRDLPTLPLYQKVKVGATRVGVTGFLLDPTNQQDTHNIAEWDIAE